MIEQKTIQSEEEMKIDSKSFLQLMNDAALMHESVNQKRGHDKEVPYFCHPLACAMWVLEDNNGKLSTEQRVEAALTLLFHDVIEDAKQTPNDVFNCLKKVLPQKISRKIVENVINCTLEPGLSSKDEYEKLKNIELPDQIWYVKLVDKYFNLFGSVHYFEKKGTLDFYKEFLLFLTQKVENTSYGESKFVSQARELVLSLSPKQQNTSNVVVEKKTNIKNGF